MMARAQTVSSHMAAVYDFPVLDAVDDYHLDDGVSVECFDEALPVIESVTARAVAGSVLHGDVVAGVTFG